MRYTISLPDVTPGDGLRLVWDDNFSIVVSVNPTEVSVKANRAGLISLARHLLTLARDDVRQGTHVHLTADQEIDSSVDLILERLID